MSNRRLSDLEIDQSETVQNTSAGTFEIFLAWSDQVLSVGPQDTALSVLVAAGVPIEPECGSGACGMCVTAYVEGDVVHKDSCLTPEDRTRNFCPCVSRATSRIVLAL